MTTTIEPPAAVFDKDRRFLLTNASWELYQHLLQEIGDGHVRLTFDQGRLEFMSPSGFHERIKKIVARLIETYADEVGIEVEGFGSTTFDREDLQKGLEPDECYYVTNLPAVVGKADFDPSVDPPPDLAFEVDISRPDIRREPIYAALGVPEVWRFDGQRLSFLHRTRDGRYVESQSSLCFPRLSLSELNRWIQISRETGQGAAVRALRKWVRSQEQS